MYVSTLSYIAVSRYYCPVRFYEGYKLRNVLNYCEEREKLKLYIAYEMHRNITEAFFTIRKCHSYYFTYLSDIVCSRYVTHYTSSSLATK